MRTPTLDHYYNTVSQNTTVQQRIKG